MTAVDGAAAPHPHRIETGRIILGGLGLIGIGVGGVLAIIGAPSLRELISVGAWLLVPALLSDLVLMPIAAVLSVLVTRHLPAPWRAPAAVGLALSAFVVMIGWPFISGFGRHPDNPSLLNRDYLGGALVVLGLIWLACVTAAVITTVAGRRRSRTRALPDDQLG